MKTLYFITGNEGKFVEVKGKFKSLSIALVQNDLGYPEIQADTLEEVARFGVETLQKRCSESFILEDAGLFIDTLKGFPGVYSKYVFYTIGLDRILRLLHDKKKSQRTAVFRSVFALKEPKKPAMFFFGECRGHIAPKTKGNNGFGFDPIFIPQGKTQTFAEMTIEEKNRFSHRGKAIEQLIRYLEKK
ncbi:MAG: XTP/dITP diphosphatase [Euryarchaeota archaeon]|nr:XTP/dITP diphosphatase [Euryarchaeota archaeon]